MKAKSLLILSGIFLLPVLTHGHALQFASSDMTAFQTWWNFVGLGFTHILPLGLDHVLFVLALFFLSPNIRTALWQATAFTIAHSITLGLAMAGKIEPPPSIIEPIISLSIVLIAVENLMGGKLNGARIFTVILFGFVHGCGFASALLEQPIPQNNFVASVLSFNIGVELGQLVVILFAWMMTKHFAEKNWYRKRIVIPVSLAIAFVALFWTFERTLN